MKLLSYILCLLTFLICLSGCNKTLSNQAGTSSMDLFHDETSQIDAEFQTESETEKSSSKEQNASKSEITTKESFSKEENSSTTETTIEDQSSKEENSSTTVEGTTEQQLNNKVEDLKNSDVVTYYSENPNNKYICAVAKKYNVDKRCLVALIRTKAQNPGATVLQFSGKLDANGNLLTTKDELVYIYEVNDTDGTIKKAAKNATENDGYTSAESNMIFMLTNQFIIPDLKRMKTENVYFE